MNKAILWNAVLIEIFAAVVIIGLRQQTFVSEEIKLDCICRMEVREVIGNRGEEKRYHNSSSMNGKKVLHCY